MSQTGIRWIVLVTANVAVWCVLSFYETTDAAPQGGQQPFSNAVEQRQQMIRELQDMKALLKEQNVLLRAAADPNAQHDRRQP